MLACCSFNYKLFSSICVKLLIDLLYLFLLISSISRQLFSSVIDKLFSLRFAYIHVLCFMIADGLFSKAGRCSFLLKMRMYNSQIIMNGCPL